MVSKRAAVLWGTVALLGLGALIAWFAWVRCGFRGCPDLDLLRGYVPDEASVVLDRNGVELTKLYRVRRVVVPLDSLPDYVPAAFVAVEDRQFWEHEGVDWSRVLGAAWENLRSLEIEEGFSTISMQLARNLFPERLPGEEQTLSRKLGEMRVAMEIEDRYGKQQILELYLNQIYFGEGAWGIESAAREYFGKSAKDLELSEAALLAGVPRAPSRLNPRVDAKGAVARRDLVLRMMAEQGWVTKLAAARAADQPLELSRSERDGEEEAPYFVQEVRRIMEAELGEAVYTGGYTIHTTLDLDIQTVVEEELVQQLEAVESGVFGRFRHPSYPAEGEGEGDGVAGGGAARNRYLQGAAVMIEAATGDVLALVGGRDFEDSKYNRATQAQRQPGSAFKPFVYAAALAAGIPLTYRLEDTPYRLVLENGDVWTPQNYGGSYAGVVTMREALVRSRNVATLRLAEAVGIEEVVEMAHRLGIEGRIPAVPSIALGAEEVTLLDLTAAYAVFATLGLRPEPRFVTRVEDRDGRVVWSRPPRAERVLDPAVAFLVTDVLSDVVNRGTATAVRAAGYRAAAAGKTGTTNDARNVWFIGFTPERVTGVWIGLDRPDRIVSGATGGGLAAPVWGRIMRRVGPDPGGWSPPPGVETRLIDADGTPVGRGCPAYGAVRREYFLAGTAPFGHCLLGRPYGWPDTLAPWDTTGGLTPDDEPGWLDRLRRRFFGEDDESAESRRDRRDEGQPGGLPRSGPDTLRLFPAPPGERPAEVDTTAPSLQPPDSAAPRRGESPDLLGRPVPRPGGTGSPP